MWVCRQRGRGPIGEGGGGEAANVGGSIADCPCNSTLISLGLELDCKCLHARSLGERGGGGGGGWEDATCINSSWLPPKLWELTSWSVSEQRGGKGGKGGVPHLGMGGGGGGGGGIYQHQQPAPPQVALRWLPPRPCWIRHHGGLQQPPALAAHPARASAGSCPSQTRPSLSALQRLIRPSMRPQSLTLACLNPEKVGRPA